MQRREPFEALLTQTLGRGWSEQFGMPVKVTAPGDSWRMQPLISAYFTGNVNSKAREYMRDSFRYTPVKSRALAQWLLGTALASKVGLKLSSRPGFDVSPQVPDADAMVVVPGNQRIRVLNFETETCRVFLKEGFDPSTMKNEIRLRGGNARGPFPLVTAAADDASWFEEGLLDAYVLPRCPPEIDRSQCESDAFSLLEEWQEPSRHWSDAATYLSALLAQAKADLQQVSSRFENDWAELESTLDALAECAAREARIELAQSHGDFQAGNIMVGRRSGQVTLIDWEHSAERSYTYDRMVFGLQTRASKGLAERIINALARDLPGVSVNGHSMAAFLLEDLAWFLHESLTGPFTIASEGLSRLRSELLSLGNLKAVLGGGA
jgi:hypothetical protein